MSVASFGLMPDTTGNTREWNTSLKNTHTNVYSYFRSNIDIRFCHTVLNIRLGYLDCQRERERERERERVLNLQIPMGLSISR